MHLVDWKLIRVPGFDALLVDVDDGDLDVIRAFQGNNGARRPTDVALARADTSTASSKGTCKAGVEHRNSDEDAGKGKKWYSVVLSITRGTAAPEKTEGEQEDSTTHAHARARTGTDPLSLLCAAEYHCAGESPPKP